MSLLLEVLDKIQNFEYNLDFLTMNNLIREHSLFSPKHSLVSLVQKVFDIDFLIEIMTKAVLRQDMSNLNSKLSLAFADFQKSFLKYPFLDLIAIEEQMEFASLREIRSRLEKQLSIFVVSLKLDNPELHNLENISPQDLMKLAKLCNKYSQFKQMLKHYESILSFSEKEEDTTVEKTTETLQSVKMQAMVELGKHYKYIGEYETMRKYLINAASLGSIDAKTLMFEYFSSNKHSGTVPMLEKLRFLYEHGMLKESHFNYVEIKLDAEMLRFIAEMDVKKVKGGFREFGYISVIRNLVKEKIDQLDLHFRYAPTAEGYKEALADFYETMVDSRNDR